MFGLHVNRIWVTTRRRRPSLVEHIAAAQAFAQETGIHLQAVQIYVAGPRSWTITLHEEEVKELKIYLSANDLWVVAHGTYLDVPWKGNPYAIKFIQKEIEICHRAGIRGFVIHLGMPEVETVLTYLPQLITKYADVRIFLEIPHMLPKNCKYETPEKLAILFRAIRGQLDSKLMYFGICIDTAHLWSCGIDISSCAGAASWLKKLEALHALIPPDNILLHINDSNDAIGSGLDHHAPLLCGKMWGSYKFAPKDSGLAAFVDYAIRYNIHVILERKDPDPNVKNPREALRNDYEILLELAPELSTIPVNQQF